MFVLVCMASRESGQRSITNTRRVDTSQVRHKSHSRPDWHSLVEQHSLGLLAGKKMGLLIGDGPNSAVTDAQRLDFLSLTP